MELTNDFPTNVLEFERKFSSEEACIGYLAQLRWPEGFRCPACGKKGWRLKSRPLFECRCGRQTSITAGTVFHGTRKPLTLWFRVMFLMVAQRPGLSAKNLMTLMGIGSYETAWTWLHKLRRAMKRPDRPKLEGDVETDESFVGGPTDGVGRGTFNPMVVAAVEREGRRIGRVRLEIVGDASADKLNAFVETHIMKGSRVRTDGWSGYKGLRKLGFDHQPQVQGTPERAAKILPAVHRVFSLLKRWLLGTHHGAVHEKHLAAYLEEFTFRFNRRTSSHRGKLFHRLAEQAVKTRAVTYKELAIEAPE